MVCHLQTISLLNNQDFLFFIIYTLRNVDKAEVNRLKRNNKVLIIVVILCLVLAIAAAVVAVYALTEDRDAEPQANGNISVNGAHSSAVSSACDGIDCLHGGTCSNINPDSYVCSCVPPFYGRRCENGTIRCILTLYTMPNYKCKGAVIINWYRGGGGIKGGGKNMSANILREGAKLECKHFEGGKI